MPVWFTLLEFSRTAFKYVFDPDRNKSLVWFLFHRKLGTEVSREKISLS